MKKKNKKPLFDARVPGGKMIVYGAVLVILGAVINSYMSWTFVVAVLFNAVESKEIMGYTISLCLQVALSLLVAIDGINNRNRPSKGRGIMINSLCVIGIAVVLLMQNDTTADGFTTGVLISGISIAGAALMFVGGLRNRKIVSK